MSIDECVKDPTLCLLKALYQRLEGELSVGAPELLKLCLLETLYCHSILTSTVLCALFWTVATRSCCIRIRTLCFVACMRERPEGRPAMVLSCTRRLICCHLLLSCLHTRSIATVWLSQASAASARCSPQLMHESSGAGPPLRSDAAATAHLQPPALGLLSRAPTARGVTSHTGVQRHC